uniref:Disease resistance protein RGA3 n=1 Tax=Triticum urartu TaxID=4572 RepID=A0A8R7RC45_TRIUA
MAESLLFPLVRGVAGKAADALCGLDDDRQTLERRLLAVECKLANAEEMSETNRYVKSWMKELKSVAYEADDVLDDFQYKALWCQSNIGKSTTCKVLSYVTRHSPLLFRFEMSRKLKNVLKKINKLVEEMNTLGLESSVRREERQYPLRQTYSKLADTKEIFGRDHAKKVVVKLLLDQQDQWKVQVLPIFGMGGLGKTTLAKMVYNDEEVHDHFQLKMWHCVSENFDVIALLKSIIELATNGSSAMPGSIEQLQKKLDEVIGQQRFLLVLDDVWNEDKRMWEDELKPLLCTVGGPGSVIVVTCRSKQVASIMSTVKPHELVFLCKEDSWELFSNKAFCNGIEQQAELATIGRRIVDKCGGLPLALKAMGGLLSSKQNVQEWKAIEESNIGDNDGGKYEIMPILKLSYKHLSSEMKQCFAFCAVFPKDYQMEKDRLIQLWMANGFIQEDGTMDLTQKGELIFNELFWRSFLQDKKVVLKSTAYGGEPRYETIVCKMHDLMHDLAKVVTDECATIEELTRQKELLKYVCHMKISKAKFEEISGLCKSKTYLHTLLAPSESWKDNHYKFPSRYKDIKELAHVLASLRALCCSPSPIVICKAIKSKHLRYLDLSESNIVVLPDSICMLYNLQTLRLIDCKELRQLSEDMIGLKMLIHLYLFGCDRLKSMSPNFGLLNNLHILTTFVVDSKDGRGIEQLKDLQHLSNKLELLNLSKIKSGGNAKEANLNQKKNLSELLFSWDQEIDDGPQNMAYNVEEVLHSLEPHSNIQKLEIRGYGGREISQWMRKPQMLNYLRELKISDCPTCKSIPTVWLSLSLEILSVQKMDNLTTLCNNNIDVESECITPLQIFPRLKRMMLIELPNLEIWAENSVRKPCDSLVMFPMVEELRIENCPKLVSIPVTPIVSEMTIVGVHSTAVSLVFMSIRLGSWPFLARLTLGYPEDIPMLLLDTQQSESQMPIEKLVSLTLEGPNSLVRSLGWSRSKLIVWKCFPFVEDLTISRCNDLVSWPTEELRCLDRLRVLRIKDCDNLEGNTSLSEEETVPLSLEKLWIASCPNMMGLPSNLGNLTKLTTLSVFSCISLKVLPDGMRGLTSLRNMTIWHCPAMEEFPHGLLERLPALEHLSLYGCPELERRCGEGGEYFHLLSSIPHKSIAEY